MNGSKYLFLPVLTHFAVSAYSEKLTPECTKSIESAHRSFRAASPLFVPETKIDYTQVFGRDRALFEINKKSREEKTKKEDEDKNMKQKDQMKRQRQDLIEKTRRNKNKKNQEARKNTNKKDKKRDSVKKKTSSKNLFDMKKEKEDIVKNDEANKKKKDDKNESIQQQKNKKKPKKKPDKKEKKQNAQGKNGNNKNKLDNRAIRIRERCETPLNIYRTCYKRAVDPSNDLEDDQFELENPFSQPFIDHDEWMVADTMYLALTQEAIMMNDVEVKCKDILSMEELLLKYLKDNIGNTDTFSPICAFIGDSNIKNELVNDGSGKVLESVALKVDVTFAFKRKFAQEIESSSQQSGLRHLVEPRNLAGCSRGGYGICCSSKASNSRGARGSATCGGGCGSSKCQRKKKKKTSRRLFDSNTLPDLYQEAFDNVVSLYTVFKPEETRGIVDAKSTEDVASCAVNRYIEDILNVPSFTCEEYREYNCINNEDLVPDESDLACVSGTSNPASDPCAHASCPGNQSCDPADGLCKDDEMLTPCIAVIDEDSEDDFDNSADWLNFRATYPDRPFCLLIPFNSQDSSRVNIPLEALSDSKFQVHNVTRDAGITPADDWFTLCGLDKLGLSNVQFVGLFVDESGSMNKYTVENSYNKFLSDVAASNLKICEVRDSNEDWTTPFMTTLTPNGGACQEAKPSTSVSTSTSTTTTVITKVATITVCNDNNPCTFDVWDPINQTCTHTLQNCSSYSKFHQCDLQDGQCKPICTDNNFCTTDVWDAATNSCSNTLVSCPTNQSCDPTDGFCKSDEMLVPCIAVIDEDNNENNTADWLAFRKDYPDRPFCLLIPDDTRGEVGIPPEALRDPKFRVYNVTRDNGKDPADDWFMLCGLDKLGSANVQFLGLFVDVSGSMDKSTVTNSYNNFLANATAINLTICEVYNGDEDWIKPFMTTLTPSGGRCVVPKEGIW